MSKIFLLLPLFLFLIMSMSISHASSLKTDNTTVNVIVKPNNTITITQNYTEIKEILNQLNSTINGKKESFTQGDIIIASSTIIAFFAFGSWFVIRFESKEEEVRPMMELILGSIGGIQIFHLSIIIMIMESRFDPNSYAWVLFATIILIIIILGAGRRIIFLENRWGRKQTISKEAMQEIRKRAIERRLLRERLERQMAEIDKIVSQSEKKTTETPAQADKIKEDNKNTKDDESKGSNSG